jgi:hypothetical protein
MIKAKIVYTAAGKDDELMDGLFAKEKITVKKIRNKGTFDKKATVLFNNTDAMGEFIKKANDICEFPVRVHKFKEI